jgi:hypothetical protein
MAPIIPTHRPWFTPERAAIGVAVLSLLCSVFLTVGTVRADTASDRGREAAAAGCPAGTAAVIASPGGVQLL